MTTDSPRYLVCVSKLGASVEVSYFTEYTDAKDWLYNNTLPSRRTGWLTDLLNMAILLETEY